MKTQWSAEKANRWYGKLSWLRGCNFIGSDCANRFDMWQSYRAKEKLFTAGRELALCRELGFNTVRLWIIFEAWLNEPEFFMEMLERYLTICADHKLSVMLCLANEEDLPRGEFAEFESRKVGEQDYALGYHQGRFPESPETAARPQWHYAQSPELAPAFWQMIREIVARYAEDERILCWNVYNEPGAALGEDCVPILERMFRVVRSCDPIQPLTADAGRRIFLRCWYLFAESVYEDYYDRPCETWNAAYENLPVVDTLLWEDREGLVLEEAAEPFSVEKEEDGVLTVSWGEKSVTFRESGIFLRNTGAFLKIAGNRAGIRLEDGRLKYAYKGAEYALEAEGARILQEGDRVLFVPEGERMALRAEITKE